MIDRERAAWLAFLARAAAWPALIAGLATLPVSVAAVALARTGAASPRAALLLAWLAGLTALAGLSYAGLCAIVAQGLRGARPWARTGALALAGVTLLVPPLGTAGGAYALWVLLRPPRSADETHEVTHGHV